MVNHSPQGDIDLKDTYSIYGSNSETNIGSTTSAPKVISMTSTQRDALTPANGMIIYNTTTSLIESYEDGAWVSAGEHDHGSLAGLSDDDHTQYLLADGSRALVGAWDMDSQATTNVNIDSGVITGITDLAVADGGTGQSTVQAAIDALTAVSGATNEHVLTKDTGTGNAVFKVSTTGIANVVEDTTPQLGGELDAQAFSIGFTAQSATGDGTTTINWGLGNKFNFKFGAQNDTFTFTDPAKPGNFTLKLVQDSGGSRTITWPASVKWSGGTAPTLTTTVDTGTDIVSFYFDGTNYFGGSILDFQ